MTNIPGLSRTPPGVKDEWRTLFDLWLALDKELHFGYDFAATDDNVLLPRDRYSKLRYFTRERSALDADNWWRDPNASPAGFLNPPFSLLLPFAKKAREQIGIAKQLFGTGTICFLCPADRPETKWWRTVTAVDDEGITRNEIRYLYPRLPYPDSEGKVQGSPLFPSAVVILRTAPWNYTRWVNWRTLTGLTSTTRKR